MKSFFPYSSLSARSQSSAAWCIVYIAGYPWQPELYHLRTRPNGDDNDFRCVSFLIIVIWSQFGGVCDWCYFGGIENRRFYLICHGDKSTENFNLFILKNTPVTYFFAIRWPIRLVEHRLSISTPCDCSFRNYHSLNFPFLFLLRMSKKKLYFIIYTLNNSRYRNTWYGHVVCRSIVFDYVARKWTNRHMRILW